MAYVLQMGMVHFVLGTDQVERPRDRQLFGLCLAIIATKKERDVVGG